MPRDESFSSLTFLLTLWLVVSFFFHPWPLMTCLLLIPVSLACTFSHVSDLMDFSHHHFDCQRFLVFACVL